MTSASAVTRHDLLIFITNLFFWFGLFGTFLRVILGRSPFPSENFALRYKEVAAKMLF
jgi:hypothetical protein